MLRCFGRRPPAPLRWALFQDVPHIIDTVWHWADFYANRLGRVSFDPPYEYRLRPEWAMPIFVMFALVSAFLVFGPTADSFCLVAGGTGMGIARRILGVVCWIAVGGIFQGVLNRATFELALGAEADSDEYCKGDRQLSDRRQHVDRIRRRWQARLAQLEPLWESVFSNVMRVMITFFFLPVAKRIAVFCAGSLLAVGTAVLVIPLGSVAAALLSDQRSLESCVQGPYAPVVWQCIALVGCLVVGLLAWRRWPSSLARFSIAAILWFLTILGLWKFAVPNNPSEASGGPYPHLYAVVMAALSIVAVLAYPIATGLTRGVPPKVRRQFRAALRRTDLQTYERVRPDVSGLMLFDALVNGIFRHLAAWLLLPAFVVFVTPSDMLVYWAIGFFVVSTVLVMYGHLSSHWVQMLLLTERWFLTGTARIVSYCVIVIAFLRLNGVQYVTTILDAAPFGVLFVIVVMTYLGIWYYEYWINRWLGECLLRILGTRRAARRGWLRCDLIERQNFTWADLKGRVLALHGTGWFCAQGHFTRQHRAEGERNPEYAFTLYSFEDLFAAIDRCAKHQSSNDIRRRIRLYFSLVNLLLIAAVGSLAWWRSVAYPSFESTPMVSAEVASAPLEQGADLAAAFRERAGTGRPLIAVAASGGGTRAAVYTAVALEGLARLGVTNEIVLLSGVSGGGVAAANFASEANVLRRTPPATDPGNPWGLYVDSMGEPFIQDVLEGAGELRIFGGSPLGVLLQESLSRRLFTGKATSLGMLPDVGLILNTTIAGHPYSDSQLLRGRIGIAGVDDSTCARPYSVLAGGRLIFTNVRQIGGFPGSDGGIPDMQLTYKVVNDPNVELAAASALTANFPTVFPNARVKLTPGSNTGCPSDSYFVTDGGATENLGLVSAIYAIQGALDSENPEGAWNNGKLPPVHLVAIEASAINYDYADDRGVGAATGGAKERINAGLTKELIEKLRRRLEARGGRLDVHYLTLPVAFRSRGGFGTHWMFPDTMKIENPLLANEPRLLDRVRRKLTGKPADSVSLSREEVVTLWRALFTRDAIFCADTGPRPKEWSEAMRRVGQWLCGKDDSRPTLSLKPDWQIGEWSRLVAAFRRD